MDATVTNLGFVFIWLCLMKSLTNGFDLTILHTNDIHARVEEMNKYNGQCSSDDASEGKCYGGIARLKTKVDELRAKYPNSLLLDGGDQYQGTLFFYIHGGQIMSHLMNILSYDAMGIGNHEFDSGVSGLVPFVNNASFDILSSNLDLSNTPRLSKIKKSTIFKVSGERIGVIGYTTTETPLISKPETVKFKDEIKSIQTEADLLINQGVDKIIALGHAGFGKDQEIARTVKGVDIVVGGHTNTFLYTGNAPAQESPQGNYPYVVNNVEGHNVLVVQDYAYGKYLGFLQATFDAQGHVTAWNGNPILLDNTVTQDAGVNDVIDFYKPEVIKVMNKTLGRALVHLDGLRSSCRVKECNMGNAVTDSMVRQNLRHSDSIEWNNVGIALLNSGGIRASITKGLITLSHGLEVMPFRNTMDIVEMSGHTILQVFEHSASQWTDSGDFSGRFLQVSGLRVVYDMRKAVGNRVVRVEAICTNCSIPRFESLRQANMYKVLVSSYLTSGGDGYEMIKDSKNNSHTIGDLDSQLFLDYIEQNSPITTGLEGRIRFMQELEQEQIDLGLSDICASSILQGSATLVIFLLVSSSAVFNL